jgi:hypothetical protein
LVNREAGQTITTTVGGDEWRARIKDRVLEATALRADGDATPYG